jgi:hypothetical protein
MPAKPPLPDGFDLPETVNDWMHDPESNKNGHVWYGPGGEQSVAVYSHFNEVEAEIADERVDGFNRSETVVERDLPDDYSRSVERRAVVAVLDRAFDWMHDHAPGEWSHPRVNEAVFSPPPGYVLDRYYVEQRDTTVYYRREGAESDVRMGEMDAPDGDPTPETHPYLVVHCWPGSGNTTVSLAPWLRAHDHEMHEVVETPAECGLDVALLKAREYASEHVEEGEDVTSPTVGQTALDSWGETA